MWNGAFMIEARYYESIRHNFAKKPDGDGGEAFGWLDSSKIGTSDSSKPTFPAFSKFGNKSLNC
jgi:hypothetical protein